MTNKKKLSQKVKILYKDDAVIAVVKPSNMIVNNADTSRYEYTLQDWVRENIKLDSTERDDSDFYNRSGIVHRLDKETSGVLLIGKSKDVFENLQSQFKKREIEKTYLALVHGKFSEAGRVSVPIGRLPWNRKRFGVMPEGREATTDFEPISFYKDPDRKNDILSYLRIFPKTGRTHQIRVHLQYAGHAIYADPFYAGRKTSSLDRKRVNRHFLHAEKIIFRNPKDNEKITVTSKLTEDLSDFLKGLDKIDFKE